MAVEKGTVLFMEAWAFRSDMAQRMETKGRSTQASSGLPLFGVTHAHSKRVTGEIASTGHKTGVGSWISTPQSLVFFLAVLVLSA